MGLTRSLNLVVGSRTATMNGNAFILGTTGAGKSQFGKGEAFQTFPGTDDDIIIVDPEKEYVALGDAMGATRIEIALVLLPVSTRCTWTVTLTLMMVAQSSLKPSSFCLCVKCLLVGLVA